MENQMETKRDKKRWSKAEKREAAKQRFEKQINDQFYGLRCSSSDEITSRRYRKILDAKPFGLRAATDLYISTTVTTPHGDRLQHGSLIFTPETLQQHYQWCEVLGEVLGNIIVGE